MREQLIQYVNLLFAGVPDSEEMKQEILQNTLDRYDDLVAQGKSPEAAYRLAISGIGDINELLGSPAPHAVPREPMPEAPKDEKEEKARKKAQAAAVAFYITCPLPLFILQNEIGLCLLLLMVAAATALLIIYGKNQPRSEAGSEAKEYDTRSQLRRSVRSVIWAVGLALYFILSFLTGAWYITWILFPIIASVQGLVIACMDLKEANKHEN